MINKIDKKAVSLMISYVLLKVITIIMSAVVFAYLKNVANVKPVIDCKEGTNIQIENYQCNIGIINLTLKNNGRFNIDGFISTFGKDDNEPMTKLVSIDKVKISNAGNYYFEKPLKPGENIIVNFSSNERKSDGKVVPIDFEFLKKIKIQPFIIDKETSTVVPCGDSIIKQDLENCKIKQSIFGVS